MSPCTDRFVNRNGPGRDAFGQRLAIDPFARQGAHALTVNQFVDLRDVGMSQRHELADVGVESGEPERISRRWSGQNTKRNETAARGVVRFPDFAESAFAYGGFELVRTKPAVRTKLHIDN